MAAREDKRGLIIALVIFVILSLALGVTTYYGFAGQSALEAKAADAAKKEQKEAAKDKWEQFQQLMLKAYLGAPMTGDEKLQFQTLRTQYDAGQLGKEEADKDAFDKLCKRLKDDINLGWDEAKKQPARNLLAVVEELENEARKHSARADQERDLREKTRKDLEDQLKNSEAEKEEVTKDLQKTKTQLAEAIKERSAGFTNLQKQVEDTQAENEDLKKKADVTADESKRVTERNQKKIRELTTQNERLRAETHPASPLDLDQPKGNVVNLNSDGSTAYISVGSSDGVRQGLTFSVYSARAGGKPSGERKAAVEVIAPVNAHLSMARVTSVRDPGGDPVVPGDLLFNPAWSPGLKQHVAVAGLIDLTGQGRDDIVEFMRNLERLGITVDAYLDLKDNQIKGPGMNKDTSFLVLGAQPEFKDEVGVLKGEMFNRQKEIAEKIGQMQGEATSYGIPVVPLRRFLGVVGYPLPKADLVHGNPFNYLRLPKSTAKPADADKKDDTEK